jgi:ABC-2 type transport system permease protein
MLKTVVTFEFVRTIEKKSFWIRTLAVPVLLAAVLMLSYFSGNAADKANEKAKKTPFSVAVLDQSGLVSKAVLAATGSRVVTDKPAEIAAVESGTVDAFFYYPHDITTQAVEIYAKDDGIFNNSKYTAVATSLLQAGLIEQIGGGERAALLQHGPNTSLVTYKNGEVTKGFGRAIVPGLFLVLFYAVIVLMGNQMLTSTTEEKENRVIEMILTSVTAQTVIIGKIIALVLLGIIQILAILTPLSIAYLGFRSQLNIPALDIASLSFAPWPILAGAAVFIGGFMLFTGLLVAIGSAVPTAKEAGGYFAFAIILIFVPFYAVGAIVSSPDQLVVQVLTFFPLTAPITLMLRNAVGNLSLRDTLVGLGILYITGVAVMAVAIRIFRYGSLEYARKVDLRQIFRRGA